VWGIIAELLGGKCALKTLASVNVINHDIHEMTLPVLYETVLFDNLDNTVPFDNALNAMVAAERFASPDVKLPGGYRFTRYATSKACGR
jgi:hypothetical protein